MNDSITIYYNNKRALLAFVFISIVLWVIGYYFKPISQYILDRNSLRAELFALISLLILIAFEVFIIYYIIKPNKTLVLNNTGFINNASFKKIGIVFWKDIDSINQTKDLFENILLIHLKEPDKYKKKITNKIAIKFLDKNEQHYGTFLIINPKLYKYNTEELIFLIKNYYQKYATNL